MAYRQIPNIMGRPRYVPNPNNGMAPTRLMPNSPVKLEVGLIDAGAEIQNDLSTIEELNKIIATEAIDAKNLGLNVEGTPMRLELMGDKEIEMNRLPQVTSTMMFQKGNIPTSDGLFSYEIFGDTADKRRKQYAYIDLGRKFFHPYIFETLQNIVHAATQVAAGMYSWRIVNGELSKIDPEDENYDPDATGIRWLIDHFHELKFEKNDSYIHNQYVDLINNCPEDKLFISKFIVIPVIYRDANFSGGQRDIPEVNEQYKRILQLVNALKASSMSAFMNNTEYSIQEALVTTRRYGQTLIQGKRGFLKQFVLGKTTVYAARNVITQPLYTGAQLPTDTLVDLFHTGFPIATCCSMGYPFIEHWILEFIAREFETKSKKQTLVKKEDGSYELQFAKIGDVTAKFTPAYVEKKVNQFIETYAHRFEPIKIPMADGTESFMLFTGNPYGTAPRHPNAPNTARRAMTWTDLLYLACVNSLEMTGKMAYITRYPMVDYFGTFPTMVRVTSTAKTCKMEFGGVQYPFYPVVELDASQAKVSTLFCDTVTMDPVYLEGIGGDHDGDTTSEKMCFSEEANAEAFEIMTDITHFVSIGGSLVQMIKNEAYLTFYNMTKRRKK